VVENLDIKVELDWEKIADLLRRPLPGRKFFFFFFVVQQIF